MIVKCKACGEVYTEDQLNGEICPKCDKPLAHIPYQISTVKDLANASPPQVNKFIVSFQKELAQNPNDKSINGALGICFLKLKLQEKALPFFEKAMEDNFSDPNPYYYAAICLLKGKKAFLAMRPEIDAMEKYLDVAINLDPQGIFHYFKAYIKYDYYSRKCFKTSPTWQEALASAESAGVSADDVTEFYQLSGVERPDCL
ncbi:MAG: hypothetical protein LBC76_05675 [Treponema sp.]|jgi:tetratricopeptide (TPR) repeat protein|nr:hypothetical protein [Treponema sp.]